MMMMLLWLSKYPKQKRQLAALAMAFLQELKIKVLCIIGLPAKNCL
jgi:hypothetical protein